ncbi:MAG: hypothetical protein HY818_05785 [Acetobacterium woodii]|nr:hypothetical protein [Acetobacterium woodii]
MTQKENVQVALDAGIPEHTTVFWTGGQLMISSVLGNMPILGMKEGYDWWGVHWTACKEAGGAFAPTVGRPPIISDIESWREQVKFPDISGIDWEAAAARDTAHLDPDKVTNFYGLANGIFERIHFLMGFEETMIALATEPEEVVVLADAITDVYVQIIEKIGQYYKPDYFTMLDDYCHQHGSFMSPTTFDQVFAPALKRIRDAAESNGMKFILHCCGREEVLLDNFYNAGVRRIEPCQPMNDLCAMKERHPDMAFMGGLDLQKVIDNPDATEEDLRKEVRRCIDTYADGGRYVVFGVTLAMHDPSAYAPGQKMHILIDEAMKYRK